MRYRVAINGFGRIGRMIMRAFLEQKTKHFDIVAINDLGSVDDHAHLLTYDSVHGRLNHAVSIDQGDLCVDAHRFKILCDKDPSSLPWKDLGIDMIMECSGRFTTKDQALLHCHNDQGAKRVIVSAPCDHADITVVYGINHQDISDAHQVISNGSCTTNCLVPLVKALDDALTVDYGYMTTIHAYTGDQRLVDSYHKDLRRARAAAHSMIPTTTGAAKSVSLIFPHLKGKLDGTAIRVPTMNVSALDFVFTTRQEVSVDVIQNIILKAQQTYVGILSTTNEPLVSCDFNHDPHSCIVDLSQIQTVGPHMGRVLAWYDNEWGFSNRMIDTVNFIASQH
jgi:glyceraldehyde 3-phosphate dehydrogenase